MPRLFRVLLAVVALLTVPVTPSLWGEDGIFSFTPHELTSAIAKSGLLRQRLYSIQSLESENGGVDIAILSASHVGWRVTVLHRIPGGFGLMWRSDSLPDDIAVSASNNLRVRSLEDHEQVIQFSGCAAHECGGKNGVFGVLFYCPRLNQVFFAHYRFDESRPIDSFGSLQFSKNAEAHGHEKYKAALKEAMLEILGNS